MIPSNLVGLVLFAASLGPGYVYIRVAERRAPRAERSDLVEAVEMVAIGAFASLAAAMVVLLVGDVTGWLEPSRITRDAKAYLIVDPVRGLVALLAVFVIAYGLAYGAARLSHLRDPPAVAPGATGWYEAFWLERPADDHLTIVTVELRDRRRVTGRLTHFTIEHGGDRELVLGAPILVRATGDSEPSRTRDAFLVPRERDVAYIAGRYVDPRTGRAAALPKAAQTPSGDEATEAPAW